MNKTLLWLTTEKCNLNCKYCTYEDSKNKDELSTEQGKNLLLQAKNLGYSALNISGGEPLIRKDFLELVDYAIEAGYRVRLNTNAVLLDKENSIKLGERPIERIIISIDSFDESNERYRGKTDSVSSGIENIVRYKNKETKIQTESVIHSENYLKFNETFKKLKSLGVDDIVFHTIHLHKDHPLYDDLSVEAMNDSDRAELFKTLKPWAVEYGFVKYLNFLECFYSGKDLEIKDCTTPARLTIIKANGDVLPCIDRPDLVLGNVKEEKLEKILESDLFKRNFEDMKSAKCLCGDCVYNLKFRLREKAPVRTSNV